MPYELGKKKKKLPQKTKTWLYRWNFFSHIFRPKCVTTRVHGVRFRTLLNTILKTAVKSRRDVSFTFPVRSVTYGLRNGRFRVAHIRLKIPNTNNRHRRSTFVSLVLFGVLNDRTPYQTARAKLTISIPHVTAEPMWFFW